MNWVIANPPPETKIAGNVSLIPLKPSTINTIRNAIITVTRHKINDVFLPRVNASKSVKVAGTVTGIPIAPYAPPAMLATKQIAADCKGLKPKPTKIAAVIATGAPNPAAPSRKALNENAIKRTWILLSGEIDEILCFITSKNPILTVNLYKKIAARTILATGHKPETIPCSAAPAILSTGIL